MNLRSSGRMMVPQADAAFDEAGRLTDDKARARLTAFLQGFTAFASRPKR